MSTHEQRMVITKIERLVEERRQLAADHPSQASLQEIALQFERALQILRDSDEFWEPKA